MYVPQMAMISFPWSVQNKIKSDFPESTFMIYPWRQVPLICLCLEYKIHTFTYFSNDYISACISSGNTGEDDFILWVKITVGQISSGQFSCGKQIQTVTDTCQLWSIGCTCPPSICTTLLTMFLPTDHKELLDRKRISNQIGPSPTFKGQDILGAMFSLRLITAYNSPLKANLVGQLLI